MSSAQGNLANEDAVNYYVSIRELAIASTVDFDSVLLQNAVFEVPISQKCIIDVQMLISNLQPSSLQHFMKVFGITISIA